MGNNMPQIKQNEVLNPKGRPAGSLNRATQEVREAFALFVENNLQTMQTDFNQLEPKDRLQFIVNVAKFVLPQLKSIDHKTETEPITSITRTIINWNDNPLENREPK